MPGGRLLIGRPNRNVYEKLPFSVNVPSPRRVLRPTPSGRSLKIRSPLVSTPVLIVYGDPLATFRLRFALKFLICCEPRNALKRWRTSLFAVPHSAARLPVAGGLNAPSV